MVRPPYWGAARIFAVAAGPTARARISGAYALNTGKDLDKLAPKLYLDVVESWVWERFQKQDDVDRWLTQLRSAPAIDMAEVDTIGLRAAISAGALLAALLVGDPEAIEQAPAGWTNAELLAQAIPAEPAYD